MDATTSGATRLGRTRLVLRDLWGLAAPYFRSEDRWRAWGLLLAVIAINLFTVFLTVQFNLWYGRFYNALQLKQWDNFVREIWIFSGLAAVFIAAYFALFYVEQWLQLRWRRWQTQCLVETWLANRAYYRVELAHSVDNPDQRIADDIRMFVALSLSLLTGLLSAVATLSSFLFLLWTMSGPLALTLFGTELAVPGYLVWVALLYAVAGTWLTHVIGRPLLDLNFQRQRTEADFRFDLVRLRENAEPIALYHGESRERRALDARFGTVIDIWWAYIRARVRLALFTNSYNQIATIFPYIVAAPRYFSGAFQLGEFIQIAEQFSHVQRSLSYFVTAYTDVAELGAVVARLTTFERAIGAAGSADGIAHRGHSAPGVATDDLRLALPDGTTLLEGLHLDLAPGKATLIAGAAGSGKTTLFRALAGLWPWGRGDVRIPAGARVLFLPQRTYLPIGRLRDAVTYPAPPESADEATIVEALGAVGLAPLATRLDDVAHWALRLSPGEQQRLAVARALLYRPDWLFLDEATASMDEADEAALYRLLRQRLPATTIVSIGHRPSLRQWHDRLLTMRRAADGRRELIEGIA